MKRYFSFITCLLFLGATVNVNAEELSSNVSSNDEEVVVDTSDISVESYDDNSVETELSTYEEIPFNNEDAVVRIPEKNARLGTTLLFSPKDAWILSANKIVRDQYGHQSTADWIIHSVSGNGSSLNYTTSSRISGKIKNDSQWKNNINSIIKANSTKKSFSYSSSMALTNGELFTGLNKISYTLNFYKLSNGSWIYSGYIQDRYDFSWLAYKNYYNNFAVTLANNAAYASQMTNIIVPFNILIYIES